MTNFIRVESAADRVAQAKRLILEARRARLQSSPLALSIQAQIEFTRLASETAAGLARMIDTLDADRHSADRAN
jgi:hypothetical protein